VDPRFVDAGGLRFGYLEQGTGPLVLLVHGFPDTAHTWDATMPALAAAGYRAVAPFTRGYHPTAIPADGAYDTDTLGNDVIALIDALGGGPRSSSVTTGARVPRTPRPRSHRRR
jgi:pimeloyl-ACP methyl ester carboxylesterase